MKIKYLKRYLSVLLTGLISLNAISFVAFAEETDDSSHFTCTVAEGVATIATFDNLITAVTMPEQVVVEGVTYKIEDQTLKIKPKLFGNSTVEKVTYPGKYTSFGDQQMFYNAKSLKEVILNYDGEDFTFNRGTFYGCSGLEKLYVYAQSINYTNQTSMFSKVPTTAVAFVKNESVKTILQELSWPGTIEIDPNMSDTPITGAYKKDLVSKITEAETFLSGIDKSKYNYIEALETAIAHAKTVNENADSTQTEVNNEIKALDSALSNVILKANKAALVSKIQEAETFLTGIDKSKYNNVAALETAIAHAKTVNENALATQTEVDNEVTALTSALSNVKLTDKTKLANMIGVYEKFLGEIDKITYTNVEAFETALAHAKTVYNSDTATQEEVDKELEDLMTARGNMKPIVDKTALKEAIDKAEAFKEGKLESDYDNYKNFTDVIVTAKMYYESDRYTQEQLDGVKDRLIAAQKKVTKADASEEKVQLDKLIEQAEALESDMFTEESWTPVETALTEAKAIDDGLKSEYNAAIEKLNTALKGLVGIELPTVPAGKPFVKVYKRGTTSTVLKTTADKDMAKAVKIRVTFDCAEDVSYNPNASIEIKAVAGGKESYKKFMGKDSSYKNGETWTEELTLTEAINEGDSVELSAFTYAWDNAKDYVYGITKVEFLNIGGSVVKSYNDQIVAAAELKSAIEKAEAIDAKKYTSESYAKLTRALETAKSLTDEATADAMNGAIKAINTAIKNLKEPTPPTKQEPSNNSQPTKPSIAQTNKSTRSLQAVAKDKKAAQKIMKQAKITKLTAKSKAKKKVTVSWKKVKKAKGYEVQISAKKNFKKPIFKKFTAKTKLNIKNKKIKSKKTYYVRVRAYATYKDKNNVTKKVYSKWIKKIRKVKVK